MDNATFKPVIRDLIDSDYEALVYMETGLTGVRRSYRRRGLATALKVKTFQCMREYGTATIRTDNEENNPMYRLNLAPGFVPQPANLEYHKVLRI